MPVTEPRVTGLGQSERASAEKRRASAVVHSAMPVSTGTRLPTWATAALRTSSIARYSGEQFSPTVPTKMMPWTPARISLSKWSAVAAKLSDWSALNCVVTAG